jgi:16S rRNA (guanine(966)-N(2))-methyltransferase RsmD
MVRESLFNIIAAYIPEAKVLDLFSGTGSFGIEALSRGADLAVFIDKSPECAAIIKDNLNHTKLSEKASVYKGEVIDVLSRSIAGSRKFDIVFMDPPYSKNIVVETMDFISKNDIINDNGLVIAEYSANDTVSERFGNFLRIDSRKYGKTIISFYRKDLED